MLRWLRTVITALLIAAWIIVAFWYGDAFLSRLADKHGSAVVYFGVSGTIYGVAAFAILVIMVHMWRNDP